MKHLRSVIMCVVLMLSLNLAGLDIGWQWVVSTERTESGTSVGTGIITDEQGNIYVTGDFSGAVDFGEYTLVSHGESDLFIAKLDTEGTFIWVKQANSTGRSRGFGISLDNRQDIYVLGDFSGTLTVGDIELSGNDQSNILIAKMDSEGNWLWAERAGGSGMSLALPVTIAGDNDSDLYIAGTFSNEIVFGDITLTTESFTASDLFLAKFNSEGEFFWALRKGDLNRGIRSMYMGSDIVFDTKNNLYLTGRFSGRVAFGEHTLISNGDSDVFVAKLDPNLNWLWANRAGGAVMDRGNALVLDRDDNLYIAGGFRDIADLGEFELINDDPSYAIFVAKTDSDGNWLWAVEAGSAMEDLPLDMILEDDDHNVLITGYIHGSTYFGEHRTQRIGEYDIFLAELDREGNWQGVVNAGGLGIDTANSISRDKEGNLFLTGKFNGEAIFGDIEVTGGTGDNLFIGKFTNN